MEKIKQLDNNNDILKKRSLSLRKFDLTKTDETDEDEYYGELILLGYNGNIESGRTNGRKNRSKMTFKRREHGNGVKKDNISEISSLPHQTQAIKDTNRHIVTYIYDQSKAFLVEYVQDSTKDMFQIGRSSETQIDFTIVDTWLAGADTFHSASPTPHHPILNKQQSQPNRHYGQKLAKNYRQNLKSNNYYSMDSSSSKSVSSTISRYACRILMNRDNLNKAYVYAAGFDSSKNIFLGEKATKWQKSNGDFDGLTTNGILILHPNRCIEGEKDVELTEMYVWREVSVDGEIYSLRETRSSTKRGELQINETNQLQDGTLIDLCGATLLWRSASGLAQSPSKFELERRLDELNAGKPQCPVNLNTLIIPRKKVSKNNSSRQPYAYLSCGHVQGKHSWGVIQDGNNPLQTSFRCPICMIESERVIQLTMGMESAFHLNSDLLDYAFNPCGHVASFATVRYWARIPLPHGTASFFPVCPFCTCILSKTKPYVRLIFQDHCFDD